MKRRITIIILTIIFIGGLMFYYQDNLVDNPKVINTNLKKYDDSYIEIIPNNALKYLELIKDNEVLLNKEEITSYNKKIESKSKAIYELETYLNMSNEEIYNLISNYSLPSLPKYDGSFIYTKENIQDILDNRNLDNINSNIRKGIIVARTNLRSLPTNKNFYSQKNLKDFDRLQETEVYVNTPVVILHESLDHNWSFVITPTYKGWVMSKDIALAKEEDLNYFQNNPSFVVITDFQVKVDNTSLDMGVKLSYLGVEENGYKVAIPVKDEFGQVSPKEVILARSKAHIGYLPFTKKNIIIEAFKYENVPYSWGGYNEGIDCSSYIANIFKTFGFIFPRNTSDQKNSVGTITYLSHLSLQEKLDVIDDEYLSILYRIGHVMLYLGKINNVNYIIHANAKDMQVSLTPLDKDNLEAIDRLVLVKK